MKKISISKHIFSSLLVFGLAACGSSSSDDTDSGSSENVAPVVDAGDDQLIDETTLITLNLTATDEDDDILTVIWSQTSGDSVTLSDTSAYTPTFTAPSVDLDSELVFQVSVDDGVNTAVTDIVTITVIDTDADSTTDTDADSTTDTDADSTTDTDADNTTDTDADNTTDTDADSTTDTDTDSTTDTDTDSTTDPWIINNSTLSTYIYEDTLTSGVVEDAQSVETVTIDDVEYTKVESTDIPKYNVVMTQDMINTLNNRPKANDDFTSGETTATVGQTVEFGQDIGYIEDTTETQNCIVTGGIGYWPPGPACPVEQDVEAYFPVSPVDTDEECATGANSIGLLVNGAAIFNWGDTFTYATSTWYNVAPVAEQYDVDICNGHSAGGAYHHHSYTSCIATLVGDEADGHSPIYGYSADGYPLYGPYESDGVLAISGWVKRDYSLTNTEGGCNSTDGERTCVLVDEYDVSQGITELTSTEYGPNVGVEVETLSGNSIAADEGYYYEDYYYAQNVVTGAQLDEHNGHDTGDGKGYHYHTTLAYDDDGTLTGSFPYHMGPTFKAELPAEAYALATCDSDEVTTGPGGDAGGPPQ